MDLALPQNSFVINIEYYFSILILLMLCSIWAKPFVKEMIGPNPYITQDDTKLEIIKYEKPNRVKSKNRKKTKK